MTADVVGAGCQIKWFLNPRRTAESAFEKKTRYCYEVYDSMYYDTPATIPYKKWILLHKHRQTLTVVR